ncbi:BolA/IbaG family iron-sulfur metabolism protein [bacterium]|nr:BolA/IbaG family iron-sulfur metabolism protein [bacterium]
MNRIERMKKLLSPLEAELLEIRDDSKNHAGHAGARPEGETHYHISIVSNAFAGMNRVDRHRKVQGLLAQEFETGLHALQIKTRTPDETSR